MCLSPDAYVWARMYERLVDRGVPPARARGVATKVARRYAEVRAERRRPTKPIAYVDHLPRS